MARRDPRSDDRTAPHRAPAARCTGSEVNVVVAVRSGIAHRSAMLGNLRRSLRGQKPPYPVAQSRAVFTLSRRRMVVYVAARRFSLGFPSVVVGNPLVLREKREIPLSENTE